MIWIGFIFIYLGLFSIYIVTFGPRRHEADISIFLQSVGIGIALLSIGVLVVRLALKSNQRKADARTVYTFEQIANMEHGSFSLFLRPFDISGIFVVRTESVLDLFAWNRYARPGIDALERVFADAYKPTSQLIGLGSRGELEFGLSTAGLVSEWQKKIQSGMDLAYHIILIPSANAGTLWEIGELKARNHFHKTILVMPPTCNPFIYKGAKRYAQIWAEAKEACREKYGIILPMYCDTGALFCIGAHYSCTKIIDFPIGSPRRVAKGINSLISQTSHSSMA
ncbi:hypothetical protein [Methylobacterium frigidaeris]|uniref:Uncharacterized protein n=1 Tax=Methylobacterium frigidaeris TaxID=2038277 RepID=A0AA37HIV9_9HYPH|nr:hypothetical protein [Methylobacterium frigidaeris]GJD66708.1 hypothetical protein MPEAHAMD_6906 [Methylobacterium frigidaeris]